MRTGDRGSGERKKGIISNKYTNRQMASVQMVCHLYICRLNSLRKTTICISSFGKASTQQFYLDIFRCLSGCAGSLLGFIVVIMLCLTVSITCIVVLAL